MEELEEDKVNEEVEDLSSSEEESEENEVVKAPPPLPKVQKKSNKGLQKAITIILIMGALSLIVNFFYQSIKRKLMTDDERIEFIYSELKAHDEIYSRLSNYSGSEYVKKFNEYLDYLVNKSTEMRIEAKKIFYSKPKFSFKTPYSYLLGGRSKREYERNLKRRLYMVGDYKQYLKESNEFLESGSTYPDPIHKKLGRPFRPTHGNKNAANKFKEVKREFSDAKGKYKNYSDRLKLKLVLLKKLKREYIFWKKKKEKTPAKEGEKEEKPLIDKTNKSDEEIQGEFIKMKNKLTLEIKSLKKLKYEYYQKYKVAKARFKKVKGSQKN